MAFRRWRHRRPFWAGFWTLLGGFIIFYFPATTFKLIFLAGQVTWLAILVGVLIMLCGLFLWFEPNLRRLISVIAVVLGVVSLITSNVGGLVIGMLLTIIGGSMGLAWVPASPPQTKEVAAPVDESSPTTGTQTATAARAQQTMASQSLPDTGGEALTAHPS